MLDRWPDWQCEKDMRDVLRDFGEAIPPELEDLLLAYAPRLFDTCPWDRDGEALREAMRRVAASLCSIDLGAEAEKREGRRHKRALAHKPYRQQLIALRKAARRLSEDLRHGRTVNRRAAKLLFGMMTPASGALQYKAKEAIFPLVKGKVPRDLRRALKRLRGIEKQPSRYLPDPSFEHIGKTDLRWILQNHIPPKKARILREFLSKLP